MISYEITCPHCQRRLEVRDGSDQRQKDVGIVYLSARCPNCAVTIGAAGIGESDAKEQMQRRLNIRVGTSVDQWRISQSQEPRKKRRLK